MSKPKTHQQDPVKAIMGCLETINGNSGQSLYSIFDDWLDIIRTSLESLPRHYQSITETGTFAPDTEETKKVFERMRDKYKRPEIWDKFTEAFVYLMDSTETWRDVLGEVYMASYISNKHTGQFFTPWHIAKVMAEMTMLDGVEKEVHERIKKTAEKNPVLGAMILAGSVIQDEEERGKYYWTAIIPLASQLVDPITVCDPCCGSGVMLLAAASCCPRWVLDWGFVQFYGMDIDETCVNMAKVNVMLYGLNGSHAYTALELPEGALSIIPEPFQEIYTEAKTATPERLEEIKVELKKSSPAYQMNLFQDDALTL